MVGGTREFPSQVIEAKHERAGLEQKQQQRQQQNQQQPLPDKGKARAQTASPVLTGV